MPPDLPPDCQALADIRRHQLTPEPPETRTKRVYLILGQTRRDEGSGFADRCVTTPPRGPKQWSQALSTARSIAKGGSGTGLAPGMAATRRSGETVSNPSGGHCYAHRPGDRASTGKKKRETRSSAGAAPPTATSLAGSWEHLYDRCAPGPPCHATKRWSRSLRAQRNQAARAGQSPCAAALVPWVGKAGASGPP